MKIQLPPNSQERERKQPRRTNLTPELLYDLRARVHELDEAGNFGVAVLLRSLNKLSIDELEKAGNFEPGRTANVAATAGAQVINLADHQAESTPVVAGKEDMSLLWPAWPTRRATWQRSP
jgi:hypothetical protein